MDDIPRIRNSKSRFTRVSVRSHHNRTVAASRRLAVNHRWCNLKQYEDWWILTGWISHLIYYDQCLLEESVAGLECLFLSSLHGWRSSVLAKDQDGAWIEQTWNVPNVTTHFQLFEYPKIFSKPCGAAGRANSVEKNLTNGLSQFRRRSDPVLRYG